MSQADASVIEQFLEKFTAGDVAGSLEFIHPNIVVDEGEGVPYADEHVGLDGFQNLLAKMFDPFEMTVHRYEVCDAESCVMVKLLMEFRSRASGRAVMMPGVELYSVTDGRVSKIDVYYKDTKTIHDLVAG